MTYDRVPPAAVLGLSCAALVTGAMRLLVTL
jgi:hypothetical protein